MEKYSLKCTAATTVGSRKRNQDVFYVDGLISSSDVTGEQRYSGEVQTEGKLHVFAVCDGIGMYQYSGPAAEAALRAVKEKHRAFAENYNPESLRAWAEDTLLYARDAMLAHCLDQGREGSCTIVLLAIINDDYVVVNSGDSPAFLYEGGALTELSVCHNMANLKLLLGQTPTEDEKCILLHHLGEKQLTYEENFGKLGEEGTFFLCSDGITSAFDEKGLQKGLKKRKEAHFFASAAGEAEHADNCTALTVSFF